MSYYFTKEVRGQPQRRRQFDALAQEVFGLSFEQWHRAGYWSGLYQPYTLFEGKRAVANASVNQLRMTYRGEKRLYIQIGTVMTAPDCRRQGLSRRLIERIIEDWRSRSDAIYLFANGAVTDFYPKFGFERAVETEFFCTPEPCAGQTRRLNMDCPADVALLRRCHERANPYSVLNATDNFGLLMFYCGSFLKESVFYSGQAGLAAIVGEEGGEPVCYDLFGEGTLPLAKAVGLFTGPEKCVRLGFTPVQAAGLQARQVNPAQRDEFLFFLNGSENLFSSKLMFPLLSHA